MSAKRRVCIIGAGTAGLCALKNSLQHDLQSTCYEQSNEIGGTWVYTEPNQLPYTAVHEVHSSMYEGLRTNLPKEVMGYPDFLYPDSIEDSFVPSGEVLKFLQSYAVHFDLKPHIKFQHSVIRVRPRKGEWEVYVWDIENDSYNVTYFDFVFVCNGHYTTPQYPQFEGMDIFAGKQMHSHLYRKASMFKDAKVLVVGAGASGMDITNHIRISAEHVFLSHHMPKQPDTSFMPNVSQKVDVKHFTESGAVFKDGSIEAFDFVVYCTGYKYTFPFLSADCGISVDQNFVQPLYKHCININYPTMALIGLPFNVCPTQHFDLQVRFALKFYTKQKQLPSREDMLEDLEKDMQQRWASGLNKNHAHNMGEKQFDHYQELCEIAGIKNVKPVIEKILKDCGRKYIFELGNYRNNCFRVIDDENFVKFTKS